MSSVLENTEIEATVKIFLDFFRVWCGRGQVVALYHWNEGGMVVKIDNRIWIVKRIILWHSQTKVTGLLICITNGIKVWAIEVKILWPSHGFLPIPIPELVYLLCSPLNQRSWLPLKDCVIASYVSIVHLFFYYMLPFIFVQSFIFNIVGY